MFDVLRGQILDQLGEELTTDVAGFRIAPITPINADRWILMSALQKAIRRGAIDIAHGAALPLMRIDRSRFWRRLLFIAFEDIGISDPVLIGKVLVAASSADWRDAHGGDAKLAAYLVTAMCAVAKDRSTDNLISIADHHPDCERDRDRLSHAGIDQMIATVRDDQAPLPSRAIAAWLAGGTRRYPARGLGQTDGEIDALFEALADIAPATIAVPCRIAVTKMRSPMPIMLPIIWAAARGTGTGKPTPIPGQHSVVRGVPTWALDPNHTRVGRDAVQRLWRRTRLLQPYTPGQIAMAVWHNDSAVVSRRFSWPGVEELIHMGAVADVCRTGLSASDAAELLLAIRDHLPALDSIRREVLERVPSPRPDLLSDQSLR
jgi:hypothetical protein